MHIWAQRHNHLHTHTHTHTHKHNHTQIAPAKSKCKSISPIAAFLSGIKRLSWCCCLRGRGDLYLTSINSYGLNVPGPLDGFIIFSAELSRKWLTPSWASLPLPRGEASGAGESVSGWHTSVVWYIKCQKTVENVHHNFTELKLKSLSRLDQ